MNARRRYSMDSRAQAAAETRARVLEAATGLLTVRLRSQIRVADVAAAAGVSEMTVLRLFGTKAGLFDAALERASSQIVEARQSAPPGDIGGSLRALLEHYEQMGDLVIGNLAQESADPAIARVVEIGRRDHAGWIKRQFGPQLAALSGRDRRLATDALVVACDVYTWKRLRRDLGRSPAQTLAVVQHLVEGVLGANPPKSL